MDSDDRGTPEAPPPAGLIRRALQRARPRLEVERWGLLVTFATLASALWLYARTPAAWTPGSDGFYSWIYARSLAFDGDIHFKNDYALCGDPFRIGIDRGTGRPDNIFYPGPALVWVPALWILRLALAGAPPAATCGRPFSTVALGLSPFLGALTAWLCYRLARRHFPDGIAALSVALLVLAGPVLKLSSVLPSYSHIHDALAVAALLVLTARAAERPLAHARWAWVAVALCACVLQRLSNAAFLAVPLVAAATALRDRRRDLWIAVAALGAGALAGLGLQGSIYSYLYGSPFVFSHGRYFLHLAHAHPFLLLFDKEDGLFFFTPTVWLSVLGLAPALRDRASRPFLIPLCAVAALEIYLSSAALDWSPARRLTNLTPLWVLLACHPLRGLAGWLRTPSRSLAAAGVLLALPFAASAMGYAWGTPRRQIPVERPLSQAELHGGAATSFFSMTDETLGSLAVLPAELAFALRYRLPRDRFGEAIFPSWYLRDFRTLRWIRRDLPFSDPRLARLLDGFEPAPGGATPLVPRPRLVFATQWPFVTHVKVRASSPGSVRLRLGEGRAVGEPRWFGEAVPLPAWTGEVELAVPPGELSSGIHELVFEFTGDDPRKVIVVSLSLDDRAPRPPPFAR